MSRVADAAHWSAEGLSGQYAVRANSRGLHITAFIIGVTSFVHFKLIGDFYPAEIALGTMILLLWRQKSGLLRNPLVKRIILFGAIWLAAQIMTDLVRSTPRVDMLRCWASISFFLMEFMGLYMLVSGSTKRLKIFLLGYTLGGLLQPMLLPSVHSIAHPWKFGYGLPVTLSLLLVMMYFVGSNLRKLKRWILPIAALGLLSFYLDFRSLAALILLTAFLIYYRGIAAGRILARRIQPTRVVMAAIILGGVGFGIIQMYSYSVQQGWLGEKALHKYQFEVGGKFGLLIGGRVELIPALYAIADSPIIGHGSWAKDPYYRGFLYKVMDLGYGRTKAQIDRAVESSDLVPAHSSILQAWVWSGILGAAFWLVVLIIVVRSAIGSFRRPNELFVLVIFFALLSIWDIFFSPFGSLIRIQWAFRLTLFLLSYQLSQQIRGKVAIK